MKIWDSVYVSTFCNNSYITLHMLWKIALPFLFPKHQFSRTSKTNWPWKFYFSYFTTLLKPNKRGLKFNLHSLHLISGSFSLLYHRFETRPKQVDYKVNFTFVFFSVRLQFLYGCHALQSRPLLVSDGKEKPSQAKL